jgi:hypothetical protein
MKDQGVLQAHFLSGLMTLELGALRPKLFTHFSVHCFMQSAPLKEMPGGMAYSQSTFFITLWPLMVLLQLAEHLTLSSA